MSTTHVDQEINEDEVRPILTNTLPYCSERVAFVGDPHYGKTTYDRVAFASKPDTKSHAEGRHFDLQHKKNQRKQESPVLRLSRIKSAARDIAILAVGAIMLETVITFSFSSLDGLYMIISTLVAGTSAYVVDGAKGY